MKEVGCVDKCVLFQFGIKHFLRYLFEYLEAYVGEYPASKTKENCYEMCVFIGYFI